MRLEALKYLGAAMTVATGISILACGGGGGGGETDGDPCTFDEDCPIEQVCNSQTSRCIFTCQEDLDCPIEETCQPRANGSGFVCLPETQPTNNGTNNPNPNNPPVGECTPDTQEADCGPEGFCDQTNTCVYPEPESTYQAIVIQDTSAGPDACSNTDPGADLLDVYLLNSSGEAIGYGFKIWHEEGEAPEGNMYLGGNLDGAPASVTTTNQCTETLSGSNALSLGCFGYVILTFQGTGGETINLEDGQQVAVFEYGSNCPTGSAADSYEVNLCTDTEAAVNNADSSSCTVVLGSNAEGYQTFSVGVPD